mmetsp:Transcript_31627/g.87291  ORF Transcript_31627/g.87291 Transcript_31627/m.87291 type:complete len:234 (+) Transcript_31627:547-1248(+)
MKKACALRSSHVFPEALAEHDALLFFPAVCLEVPPKPVSAAGHGLGLQIFAAHWTCARWLAMFEVCGRIHTLRKLGEMGRALFRAYRARERRSVCVHVDCLHRVTFLEQHRPQCVDASVDADPRWRYFVVQIPEHHRDACVRRRQGKLLRVARHAVRRHSRRFPPCYWRHSRETKCLAKPGGGGAAADIAMAADDVPPSRQRGERSGRHRLVTGLQEELSSMAPSVQPAPSAQ